MNKRESPMVMRLNAGWLTVEEARERLGLSRSGMRGALDRGTLPFDWITKGIIVVHEDDVESYLRNHRGRFGAASRRAGR